MRADGKEFPVEVTITKVSLEGPPLFTGFIRDITERKRAEKQMRDSREQLRALAAYLQSVREEERARVAREVHDELGQTLTGLKMDLARLEKNMADVSDTHELQQCEAVLKELPGRVDAIIGAVRKIATELRPPVLDRPQPVIAALRAGGQRANKATRIRPADTATYVNISAGLTPTRAT